MPEKLSIKEFAAKIKERRPDAANVPDDILVGKLLGLKPELKEFVNLDTSMPAPEGILSQLFGHLGVQQQDKAAPAVQGSAVGPPIIDNSQPSVVSEGAAQALAGMGKFAASLPGRAYDTAKSVTAMSPGDAMKSLATGGPASQALINAVKMAPGMAKSAAGMVANPPPPESPVWQGLQQQAGANLIATELPNAASGVLQGGSALVDALKNRIPSTARAGANLNTVMQAAKDVPIDTTQAGNAAIRADELRATGSSLPKVLSDYKKFPENTPMTYETGRDFASNAGALSASERMATNPQMGRQVSQFADALKTANREAASKVGMGELYDAAMKEYHAAKTIEEIAAVAKKWVGRAAIAAGLGAAGKAGYDIYGAANR